MMNRAFLVGLLAAGCSQTSTIGRNGSTDAAERTDAHVTTPVGKVACGTDACDLSANQVCCADPSSAWASTTCGPVACSATTVAITCDGPEDCSGHACCGTLATGMTCSTTSTCPASADIQFCREDGDCATGSLCCEFNSGSISGYACADMHGSGGGCS